MIFSQIVAGVSYIHRCSIVHRDLKPSNILVSSRGVVKIADFGVSYDFVEEGKKLRRQGTVSFFSPELLSDAEVPKDWDPRSQDIWAFGVVLFCCLFGRLPWFSCDANLMEIVDRITTSPFVARRASPWTRCESSSVVAASFLSLPSDCSGEALQVLNTVLSKKWQERRCMECLSGQNACSWLSHGEVDHSRHSINISEEEVANAITPLRQLSFVSFLVTQLQRLHHQAVSFDDESIS